MSFLTLLQNRDANVSTSIPVAEIQVLSSNPSITVVSEVQPEPTNFGASGSGISVAKHPIKIEIPAAQLEIESFPPSLEVFRKEILISVPGAAIRTEPLAPTTKLTYYEDTEDFEEIIALLNSII